MKKLLSIIIVLAILSATLPLVPVTSVSAAGGNVTVYVSPASGSDSNNGLTEAAAFKTFSKAFTGVTADNLTIVLLDETVLASNFVFANSKASSILVTAKTPDIELDITAKKAIGMYNNVTFDNLTLDLADQTVLCAGGKSVTIGEGVTMTNRIKIFGGGYETYNGTPASTDLTVLGGKYYSIYGGGFSSSVSGDTHLTVGGNVNAGDGIDDSASNISPCIIYGGGYTGTVGGSSNITYTDNAVAKYIVGSGYGTYDTVSGGTYINITGGKVMNVYGGSRSATVNTDTHIYMTGGLAESLFGGCESVSMTGNTLVYVGGTANVSRRVYGGCYNDWSFTWSSDCYVTGSTTIVLESSCRLASGTELSSDNSLNTGVFAGSRTSSNHDDEVNTVVYLEGCSERVSSHRLGDRSGFPDTFKSHADYIVKCTGSGTVAIGSVPGNVMIIPDDGFAADISGSIYFEPSDVKLPFEKTSVSFIPCLRVSYDIGDVEGSVPNTYLFDNTSATLAETSPAPIGYELAGWSLTPGSSNIDYDPGATYTGKENITLYAVWQLKNIPYKVCHYVQSHTDSQYELYKSETLTGTYQQQTAANALSLLGYDVQPFTQTDIAENGTTQINIIYKKGSYKAGDVNCDGQTDMLDIAILQRYLAEWDGYGANAACIYSSDCDGDGSVTLLDALMLCRELAGIENIPQDSGNTEDPWGPWV